MDTTTVQGWESGRRPLTAMAAGKFLALRRSLLTHGAERALLTLFDSAMEADAVIAHVLNDVDCRSDLAMHPLASWVFTRTSTHMIAWALTGAAPAAVPPATVEPPRRRGPTRDSPLLPPALLERFHTHMRRCAELADHAGEPGALLRRQALYLCSYDPAPDTHTWLADLRSRRPLRLSHATWSPQWADARSVATSLTRYGELDVLHGFIERAMGDDAGEIANLNYWAHWLGFDRSPYPDDSFMAERSPHRWDAGALLRGFADRLDPALGCVDLNVHSVWALIASRPGLLSADPQLASELRRRVTILLDGSQISPQARRELDAVHYGLKLSSP
ncbi:XRE family transcriptional regulator [Streptomyces triculaminicus]|uniref:XRE family transcriptional regulator n=1 Tax=Streptomyces triculaminicus TaxID=2816232 RepID=A0A939FPS4_9ACTN|nr:XRE family transcriptional regulator [Streptomyces triculaminicus]MBO0655553.1 XRE family transcriptional regulator [Streptomyces triculaminicus]